MGGQKGAPYYSDRIDYRNITSTGNFSDFGNLTVARTNTGQGSASNGTRALCCGGKIPYYDTDVIDYITIASTGNATDFGNYTAAKQRVAGVSNNTRGVFAGGYGASPSPGNLSTMAFVTIATTGNAAYFGNLSGQAFAMAGGVSNGQRGLFAGGSQEQSKIQYITINSNGDASNFGDLSGPSDRGMGCCGSSNDTRGIFWGGNPTTAYTIIDYVTIASTGNATDFGDSQGVNTESSSAANSTRSLCAGSTTDGDASNICVYVTIDTTGNSTDFGDLSEARKVPAGTSGADS